MRNDIKMSYICNISEKFLASYRRCTPILELYISLHSLMVGDIAFNEGANKEFLRLNVCVKMRSKMQ